MLDDDAYVHTGCLGQTSQSLSNDPQSNAQSHSGKDSAILEVELLYCFYLQHLQVVVECDEAS